MFSCVLNTGEFIPIVDHFITQRRGYSFTSQAALNVQQEWHETNLNDAVFNFE